jgi:phage-related protein (TIGR01555 family)
VTQAAVWGRLFGGARIIAGARGAGRPETPMNEESVKGIEFLTVLDRRSLFPRTYYDDPMRPSYGETETYHVVPITRNRGAGVICHESRMIAFGGALTDPQLREQVNGWDLSVLHPVHDALRSTGQNWQSISNMLSDASQGVFKIKGLIDAIADGDTSDMQTRMELIDMARSVARSVVIDADGEDFGYVERGALSGMDAVLNANWQRLAAAARMPLSILMGQSPAGLQNNGSIDLRWWYDSVRVYQNDDLAPALERIIRMIVRGLFPGDDPQAWTVEFPSLWQMTPTEQVEYDAKILDNDQKAIAMGLVDPMEVSVSRFRDGKIAPGYSAVDIDSKRAMLEIAIADMLNPEPEPIPGADPNDPNAPPPVAIKAADPVPPEGEDEEETPEP